MKLKIKKVRDGKFKSSEGEMISYFWYKALRGEDGVTIEFGSKNEYEVDDEIDIELEKSERAGGRFGYKEPSDL